jgi:hypothetical protein
MKTKLLDFQFISDDGQRITYQAVIVDKVSPLKPVFTLTVITGSPHGREEQTELKQFLAQVEAAFTVERAATRSPVVNRPIPFHPKKDILFIAELVTINHSGTFHVQFEVVSSIDDILKPAASRQSGTAGPVGTRQGKRHIYFDKVQKFEAAGQLPTAARVTCSRGAVQVSPGPVGVNGPVDARAFPPAEVDTRETSEIKITGDDPSGRSTFKIHADFHRIF